MDIQTIDNQYNQMQAQAQQTIGELKDLAAKLQAATAAGNQDAREWLLDLKSIAIAIQAEQNQVAGLLQAIHNFADNQRQQVQQLPQQPGWGQTPNYPQQPYPQQAPYGYGQPQGGGFLGDLLNSGFGRAIVTGAGFGIGDDLINKIF
jgi:hypothetical protein